MPASIYERELKGILEGDVNVLKRVIKRCDAETSRKYLLVERMPFLTVRAAGSLGFDLLAVRGEMAFPIEVKSSSERSIMFTSNSSREVRQAELFLDRCERSGLFPIYAFRLKNGKNDLWRTFKLGVDKVSRNLETIYRALPELDKTRQNNYVLRWDNGMPLGDLIELLCTPPKTG